MRDYFWHQVVSVLDLEAVQVVVVREPSKNSQFGWIVPDFKLAINAWIWVQIASLVKAENEWVPWALGPGILTWPGDISEAPKYSIVLLWFCNKKGRTRSIALCMKVFGIESISCCLVYQFTLKYLCAAKLVSYPLEKAKLLFQILKNYRTKTLLLRYKLVQHTIQGIDILLLLNN